MEGGRSEILKADDLYHVYESKAEDGNVVALRGYTSPCSRARQSQ